MKKRTHAFKVQRAEAARKSIYAAAYPAGIESALAENRAEFERLKRLFPQIERTSLTDSDLDGVDEIPEIFNLPLIPQRQVEIQIVKREPLPFYFIDEDDVPAADDED